MDVSLDSSLWSSLVSPCVGPSLGHPNEINWKSSILGDGGGGKMDSLDEGEQEGMETCVEGVEETGYGT